jgi:hypothetical protein
MPDHRHAGLCEQLRSVQRIDMAARLEAAVAIDELHAENARLRRACGEVWAAVDEWQTVGSDKRGNQLIWERLTNARQNLRDILEAPSHD